MVARFHFKLRRKRAGTALTGEEQEVGGSTLMRKKDHFSHISENVEKSCFSPEFQLENGRVITGGTSDLYPGRLLLLNVYNKHIMIHFFASGEFQIRHQKRRGRIWKCVFTTFASPE